MSITLSFKSIKNKHDVYRDKDYMKKFHGFLRKYGMVIINFKTEKMKLLSNEQQTSYQVAKTVIFVKKNLKINMLKKKSS